MVAITPEIWKVKPFQMRFSHITCAEIKVRWAKTIVSVISTASLFLIRPMIREKIYHERKPKRIPQINIELNIATPFPTTDQSTSLPSLMIHKITKKSARAVPSLKRLSPSKMVTSLFGAPTDLKSVNTATVSVAEIRLPKRRHTRNGIWKPKSGKI